MTDSSSGTGLVWDLLVCSQLTGLTGEGGLQLPILNDSPHIHLAVPIIQGSVHERSLPAPAVKSGSWNLKAHAALSRCTVALAPFWLFDSFQHEAAASATAVALCVCVCVCVCNCVSCSEMHKAVWECVSVNLKTFITTFSAGMKPVAHSLSVCLSLSVSSVNWPIFFHMTCLQKYKCRSFDLHWGSLRFFMAILSYKTPTQWPLTQPCWIFLRDQRRLST